MQSGDSESSPLVTESPTLSSEAPAQTVSETPEAPPAAQEVPNTPSETLGEKPEKPEPEPETPEPEKPETRHETRIITVRNVEEAKARLAQTLAHFKSNGLTEPTLYEVDAHQSPIIGCANSHRSLAEMALKNLTSTFTVFECDARPHPHLWPRWFSEVLPFAMSGQCPFDLIFGGVSSANFDSKQKPVSIPISPSSCNKKPLHLIHFSNSGSGFFCYCAVTEKGRKLIADCKFAGARDIDVQVVRSAAAASCRMAVVYPFLCTVADGYSLLKKGVRSHSKSCANVENRIRHSWPSI